MNKGRTLRSSTSALNSQVAVANLTSWLLLDYSLFKAMTEDINNIASPYQVLLGFNY
jgi:hypothetical protein